MKRPNLLIKVVKPSLSAPYGAVAICCVLIVIGSAVIGAVWSSGYDVKEVISIWDLVLKALAGFLALIGAALAVLRYLDDRAKAIEAAVLEARKPFLTKRQDVYQDLVTATATIATVEDYGSDFSKQAEREFWILFFGRLPIVTDEAVSVLVDEYSELLADHVDDWVQLRNVSMNIARACRSSMGFDAPLPSIDRRVLPSPKGPGS